jgi:hypothetical protein
MPAMRERKPPLTAKQRATILKLHADGLGRNQIARTTGLGAATVTKVIHEAGLSFDRTATKAAVEARRIDLADARTRLTERLYTRATSILDRLEADTYTAVMRASFGEEKPQTLQFVPARDERDLAAALGVLATQAARLEQVGNPAGEKVKGLLGEIADQIGL